MLFMSIFVFFYRVCTLLFEPLRFYVIYSGIHHSKVRRGSEESVYSELSLLSTESNHDSDYSHQDPELRSSLRFVLEQCYLGDWFLLLQLSKNTNVYFFRAFIKQLRKELQGRPKIRRLKPALDKEITEERMAYLRRITHETQENKG